MVLSGILTEVRENLRLLELCKRHSFEPIESTPPGRRIFTKWRCSACGGVVDGAARNWYLRGIEHAAG